MNFVHSMLPYGPYDKPSDGGGVNINCSFPPEVTFKGKTYTNCPMLKETTLKNYISSPYANCIDYSVMLHKFFLHLGLNDQVIVTPDHVYNELTFNNKKYIFDATHNIVVAASNSDFMNPKLDKKMQYYLLPLSGSRAKSKNFRPERGQRRYFYILTRGRIEKRSSAVPTLINEKENVLNKEALPAYFFIDILKTRDLARHKELV